MTRGITMTQKLYADSLDLELQVNYFPTFSTHKNYFSLFIHTGALAYSGSRYNPGSGPIYLDDVACSGSENSINDCSRGNYGYASTNCRSHFEDASVLCPICMKINI